MSIKWMLIGIPMFMMIVSILVGGNSTVNGTPSLNGTPNPVVFGNAGNQPGNTPPTNGDLATLDCSGFPGTIFQTTPCTGSLPQSVYVYCGVQISSGCYITSPCPPNFVGGGGLFCNTFLNRVYEQPGTTVLLSGSSSQNTKNNLIFGFGSLQSGDFIGWIVTAVGIIAILSITIFGSGAINSESAQILFQASILVALWVMFTGLEGFPSGSSTSFFVGMNSAIAGFGTVFYTVLSLCYVIGILSFITRSI